MGECHCAEGQGMGSRLPGGVEKTDIARAAAERAIEALSEIDEVGVLAFNTEHEWLIDLQQLPPEDVVRDGPRLPSGPTAAPTCASSPDRRPPSSCGEPAPPSSTSSCSPTASPTADVFDDLADEAAALYAEEGITVSVIATGEGAADQLEEIAEAGARPLLPGP